MERCLYVWVCVYPGVETKRGHEEAVTQGGCSSAWRVEWYPEPHLVSLRGEPTDRSSPGRIMIQDGCASGNFV